MLHVISKKGASYDFSSIQFMLPDNISNSIRKWGRNNIPASSLYHDSDGSKGRENQSHVTVKYGLHTNDVELVRDTLKECQSFDIILDEVSRFSKPDVEFDVVKINVKGSELFKLNKLISTELKCTDTYPTYKPHITIAYVQSGLCSDLSGDNSFKGRRIRVEKLHFSPSKGRDLIINLN